MTRLTHIEQPPNVNARNELQMTLWDLHDIAKLSASVKASFINPVHCFVILPTSVAPSLDRSWKEKSKGNFDQFHWFSIKSYGELNVGAPTRTDWATDFENSFAVFI